MINLRREKGKNSAPSNGISNEEDIKKQTNNKTKP